MRIKSLLLSLLLLISFSVSANEYPVLTEIVTDNAHIFTAEQLQSLTTKLKDFEDKTTNQLVVVSIESLNGESIESYALETFNRNKLGQKDVDNGVLILFAKLDREVRIEVGYGLEPVLTDSISGIIIHDVMIPEFKNEHYYAGIHQATDDIIALINDPALAGEYTQKESTGMPLPVMIFLGVFIILGGGMILFFIVLSGSAFIKNYKDLIEAYWGFFVGKISLLHFPFLLFALAFTFAITAIFIIVPIGFAVFFVSTVLEVDFQRLAPDFNFDGYDTIFYLFLGLAFFLIPVLIALYRVMTGKKSTFSFSLAKSNKSYLKRHFPSGGGSSSSSSGGGFSGGGGSSGGGGASGSW